MASNSTLLMAQNLQNGLIATAKPSSGLLEITLIKDGKPLASTDMPMNQACNAAAVIRMAAKTRHEMQGCPQLPEPRPLEAYANLPPSALNLGPSHIPNSDSLIFYFGE